MDRLQDTKAQSPTAFLVPELSLLLRGSPQTNGRRPTVKKVARVLPYCTSSLWSSLSLHCYHDLFGSTSIRYLGCEKAETLSHRSNGIAHESQSGRVRRPIRALRWGPPKSLDIRDGPRRSLQDIAVLPKSQMFADLLA